MTAYHVLLCPLLVLPVGFPGLPCLFLSSVSWVFAASPRQASRASDTQIISSRYHLQFLEWWTTDRTETPSLWTPCPLFLHQNPSQETFFVWSPAPFFWTWVQDCLSQEPSATWLHFILRATRFFIQSWVTSMRPTLPELSPEAINHFWRRDYLRDDLHLTL